MNANVAQCRYSLSVAAPILASLGDAHRAAAPHPGAKTAGWLVGHLAVTGDFARKLCGRSTICPVEWRPLFNPGSQPSARESDYPPMADLRAKLDAVYSDLCIAVEEADPKLLARDNPFVPTRGSFPTAGDFVAYITSPHLAYHLGQLQAVHAALRIESPASAMKG